MVGIRGSADDAVNRGRLGPRGLFAGRQGVQHGDRLTRPLVREATAAMSLKTFGADGQPGCYADVEHCNSLFRFSHNMAETQTVLWSRVLDRCAGADPPALVCVDPQETEVARAADHGAAPRARFGRAGHGW